MPKLSPEWQQPGDLGIARPDNHTTSRRCSGVSLGSTRRRPATCFVTIGPWGVSRDQQRGGAGAARRHDLREGPLPSLNGFHTQKPSAWVCRESFVSAAAREPRAPPAGSQSAGTARVDLPPPPLRRHFFGLKPNANRRGAAPSDSRTYLSTSLSPLMKSGEPRALATCSESESRETSSILEWQVGAGLAVSSARVGGCVGRVEAAWAAALWRGNG